MQWSQEKEQQIWFVYGV